MAKYKLKTTVDLDELNRERVETTKLRVAHAVNIIHSPTERLCNSGDDFEPSDEIADFSHAVNILEAAVEEMQWACSHFGWDNSVCQLIDDAIVCLGRAISMMVYPDEKDYIDIGFSAYSAEIALSKCVATLVRWHENGLDVSEV